MSERMSRLRVLSALLLALGACHREEDAKPPRGSIDEVVVIVRGSSSPLHFDPRGSRITIVGQEIRRLIGHPIVLELDTALSPELKASLEETVLASFENVARELVLLQKEDAEMFAKAQQLERIVCSYDAVAKESQGTLEPNGKRLLVRAPPDRFPLLERWIFTQAIYDAHVGDLDRRWADVDPTQLAAREQPSWFAYMTKTRPGAGYLWTVYQRKKGGVPEDDLRFEHISRIARFSAVVEKGSLLAKRVRGFLLEHAAFVGRSGQGLETMAHRATPAVVQRAVSDCEDWILRDLPRFDEEEHLRFARLVFEVEGGAWRARSQNAESRRPPAMFPRVDRFAYGMSVYDAWIKDNAPLALPQTPRGEIVRLVVCPKKRFAEATTSAPDACSPFFSLVLRDEGPRSRLAERIAAQKDVRLLEVALLNVGSGYGAEAVAFLEALKDEAMFRHGFQVLFHDLARTDVKGALEKAAPRWWRDQPGRRGLALLVFARQWEHLDTHYGDNQWNRWLAEFGGPVHRDVLASYLAEGPRAVELMPRIWPGLAKGADRDDLAAKSLPVLLAWDKDHRTTRARATLGLLRTRLCTERNVHGLDVVRSAADRWGREHPDDAAAVANARSDFTLGRCLSPSQD